MTSLLFAMVGSFLIATGARDQLLVAGLVNSLGQSPALLLTGMMTSAASAVIAAWFGSQLAQTMSDSAATMFVAIVLLLAAIECAWPNRRNEPREPTRSLGAIAIVLFARQLTDASRFLLAGLAVVLVPWQLVAAGGAMGGSGALIVGWTAGASLSQRLPLRSIRLGLALVLFVLAALTALSARGIIG